MQITEMNPVEIGKRLIELRGSRTQQEVADSIGVAVSTYSMYENGQRIPRDNTKIRIANYFKKPIYKIFF